MDILQEETLFKIISDNGGNYKLFKLIKLFTEDQIDKTIGLENGQFYDVLRLLSDSINNSGCENRRSEQIDLINK